MALTDQEIKHCISEITSGKRLFHLKCIEDKIDLVLVFEMPAQKVRLNADLAFDATLIRAKSYGIPTLRELESSAVDSGFISQRDHDRLSDLNSRLSKLKLMRSRTASKIQLVEIEKEIRAAENIISDIHNKHQKYFAMSAESQAEKEKTIFLIWHGVLNLDGTQFWSSVDEFKKDKRQKTQAILIKEYLAFARGYETRTLRQVARHREWRIYWRACIKTGSTLFNGSTTDWDINKLLLTYWSDFYENIFAHSNPPSDDIVNDDYKCDIWIEDQLRGVQEQGRGIVSETTNGRTKMTHHVNESYRVQTQSEWQAEQQEKERIANRRK